MIQNVYWDAVHTIIDCMTRDQTEAAQSRWCILIGCAAVRLSNCRSSSRGLMGLSDELYLCGVRTNAMLASLSQVVPVMANQSDNGRCWTS